MVYLVTSLVFVSLGMLFTLLVAVFYWKRIEVKYRLQMIEETLGAQEGFVESRKKTSFKQRVILPIRKKVSEAAKRITPRGTANRIEAKLRAADHPYRMGVTGWLAFRAAMLVGLPSVYMVFVFPTIEDLVLKLLLLAIVVLLGFVLPGMALNAKINERKIRMTQQLPDILDLLTVSVEAGMSFDGAMGKVAEKGTNELSREFGKVVKEIEIGKTRRAALNDMSKRCDLPDLQVFISSIIQAEQMGVSIGKILRIQAENIRIKRRQRAQETAMKAPVKMLFPLVFFIFPSLFVVLLGPAMIKMRDLF